MYKDLGLTLKQLEELENIQRETGLTHAALHDEWRLRQEKLQNMPSMYEFHSPWRQYVHPLYVLKAK
jgi:hypothetical protein